MRPNLMNKLLPDLAVRAPEEFLRQLDFSLKGNSPQIVDTFANSNEDKSTSFSSVWLVRALEALAWDDAYFELACLKLCELTEVDTKYGQSDKFFESLVTIMLPWAPQTNANWEKRKKTIEAIIKNHNDLGWKLLLELLPNRVSFTRGTYKPSGSSDEAMKSDVVSHKDYWEQLNFFANLTLRQMGANIERITELIFLLDYLPNAAFQNFIDKSKTKKFQKFSESEKNKIAKELRGLIRKHKQSPDADWVFSNDKIKMLNETVNRLNNKRNSNKGKTKSKAIKGKQAEKALIPQLHSEAQISI